SGGCGNARGLGARRGLASAAARRRVVPGGGQKARLGPAVPVSIAALAHVSAIDDLVTELAKLPGIGRKTAQRLTFYLLKQPADSAARLADAIRTVRERVTTCGVCGTLTDEDPCSICRDPRRDASVVCVVEEASEVPAVERAGRFPGRYHVLGGRLSPLEGIGPEALRFDRLLARVTNGGAAGVAEVVIATDPAMAGGVTV